MMTLFFRYLLSTALALLLCLAASPVGAAPRSPSETIARDAASSRPFIVGVMRDLLPYESVDPEGVAIGYHVDLVRALAREMNLSIEFHS
jgi:ABC-type amino acid transport substrate-binding protein